MRDEAPVYYNEEHDFYALTRHEDVAAAFKDYETFSSACGLRPRDGAIRRGAAEVDHLHGPARAPAHAQPGQQGVHPAGHPVACARRSTELIDHYLAKADPRRFDVVQDFSGPFPVEVITRMARRAGGLPPAGPALGRHLLHREPGQIDMSEDNMQAIVDSWRCTTTAWSRSAVQNPCDDMFSRLSPPRSRARTARRRSSTTSRSLASQRFWAARAPRPSPSWSAARWWCSRDIPDQWQKLLDDRSKIPAAVEELLRYVGAGAVQRALQRQRGGAAQRHHCRQQACLPDGRGCQPRSARLRRRRDVRHRPRPHSRRRTSASATASTVASAQRLPGWRARSRSSTCWTSCRATRSTSTVCRAGQHAERRRLVTHYPAVRVFDSDPVPDERAVSPVRAGWLRGSRRPLSGASPLPGSRRSGTTPGRL